MKKLNADEIFENLSQQMLNRFLEKNPEYATYLGLHDPYDYLLPDGSSKRLLENLQLLEEWIKTLSKTVNREELNAEHKIDWEVIEKTLERWKFDFYERRIHELNPDVFEELGGMIFIMFTRNYAPLEKRIDAIAARIEKIPRYLEEFHSRFVNTQLVKLWTEIAVETAQQIGGLFQFILFVTKDKVSDKIYARLSKSVENLQPALKAHMEWLQRLRSKTTEEWALGKAKFEKLVQLRDLGMNSDEIYRLGVKYLEELKSQREQLAKQIAPGKPVEEVLKLIESKSPKTFEEALEYTKETIEEARRFVQEKISQQYIPKMCCL